MARIIIRIILFLFALEMFFNIGGVLNTVVDNAKIGQSLKSQNEYRILCIGDSMTYDGEGLSYPAQLQQLIQQRFPQKNIKVINKSIAGGNSGIVINRVSALIDEYKPQMVIAMMGIEDVQDKEIVLNNFNQLMGSFKTFRLLILLKDHFIDYIDRFNGAKKNTKEEVYKAPLEIFIERLNILPRDVGDLYYTALIFLNKGNYPLAEELLLKILNNSTDEGINYYLRIKLADIYRVTRSYDKYMAIIKYKLDKNPQDPWVAQWTAKMCTDADWFNAFIPRLIDYSLKSPDTIAFYDLMGGCLAAIGEDQKSMIMIRKAEELRVKNINTRTKKSYLELLKMLNENNIKPVFVQYPLRDLNMLKAFFVGEDVRSVVFIDNKNNFEKVVVEKGYEAIFKDRFGGNFGHCTAYGYLLIAQNILNHIAQQFE